MTASLVRQPAYLEEASPELLQEVCPICRISYLRKTSRYSWRDPRTGENFEFVEKSCKRCKTSRWDCSEPEKLAEKLSKYYEDYKDPYASTRKILKVWHFEILKRYGEELQRLQGQKVLEVGFGGGAFCRLLQGLGAQVFGVESDENARIEADWHSFVDLSNLRGQPFSAVFFFEVLEHLDDPKSFLEELELAPGGWIAGSVPNRERLFFHASGRHKAGDWDFPPHHKWSFSARGLVELFDSVGYFCEVHPVHHGLQYTRAALKKVSPRLLPLARLIDCYMRASGKGLTLSFRAQKKSFQ